VALTGFGMNEDIERALASGFNAHITKPVDLDQLLEVALSIKGYAPRSDMER
jgi:CheY-like chemotaxis protein